MIAAIEIPVSYVTTTVQVAIMAVQLAGCGWGLLMTLNGLRKDPVKGRNYVMMVTGGIIFSMFAASICFELGVIRFT